MSDHYGDFPASATVYMIFDSFASLSGASSATSNFASSDVQIYKDGSVTQRASANGITASTSFDSQTGLQMVAIDLSDNSDAGFYAVGHEYQVAIADVTIDGQTVRFWLGSFSIERSGGILSLLKAAGTIQVDAVKISGDSTAADNLEAMFDGTGYDNTKAPATQDQVSHIAVTGAALNLSAASFVLTVGTETSGTVASAKTADGTYHQLTSSAGTLDAYYQFDVGTDGTPVGVFFDEHQTSVIGNVSVFAYNWGTVAWDQIGTLPLSAADQDHDFELLTVHVGTGGNVGLVRVRVYGTGLTTLNLYIDQIFLSYARYLDATAVRGAVGLASANLDTQLGTIAGYVDTEVAAIKAKTDNLPSDPADASDVAAAFSTVNNTLATIAGYVDTEVAAIKVVTDALGSTGAANLNKTTNAIGRGTVDSGASTTSVPTSAFLPAGAVADQFKGRTVLFDANTTTLALRGQGGVISASSNAAAPTLTLSEALTTAPAAGDTFSVI